jgi:hypothetical protein
MEFLLGTGAKRSAGPARVDCQFMATALATFLTSRNWAGEVAADYGFNVTDTGMLAVPRQQAVYTRNWRNGCTF